MQAYCGRPATRFRSSTWASRARPPCRLTAACAIPDTLPACLLTSDPARRAMAARAQLPARVAIDGAHWGQAPEICRSRRPHGRPDDGDGPGGLCPDTLVVT